MKYRISHYISFLCMVFVSITASAEGNPFLELFRQNFSSTDRATDISNLRSLVGDTIIIDTQSRIPLGNVLCENPDTVWIKDKPSKKPKEGKDFLLCFNYKGIRDDKNFYTPAEAINNKPFAFLSVKELRKGTGYFADKLGYELTLIEPETANLIYFTIPTNFSNEWRIYSKKANDKIASWLNASFHKRAGSYDNRIETYRLTNGEMYLRATAIAGGVFLKPYAQFTLTSDKVEPLSLTFDSNDNLSYDLIRMKFLSQSEYATETERTRTYEIETAYPTDSLFRNKIRHLPFKLIGGEVTSYLPYVSQTIKPDYPALGRVTIPHGSFLLIADKITVRGTEYYKAAFHGKALFIECKDVNLMSKSYFEKLLKEPQEVRDAFFDCAKVVSRMRYYQERKENLEKFLDAAKRGIMVLNARPYDMSEYTDGTGMRFSIINATDKVIKYITFNFTGYNAVDDAVSSQGKTALTRKGIGPIDPLETASYKYEYVWFTDVVEYAKLRSIVVQYKDGTSRTFTGNALNIISDDVINASDYKSPVADFLPIFDEDKDDN